MAKVSLIPIGIIGSNNKGFVVSSTSTNTSPYNAFDGTTSAYYRSSIAPSLPESLTVAFPKSYRIDSYTVQIGYGAGSLSNMKTWDFYGLVNGVYTLLHSGINPATSATPATITGTFNPIYVTGIKVTCKSEYGTNSWGMDELQVFETKPKYMIKQYSSYYSINPSYYDTVTKAYIPLSLSGGTTPNSSDIATYGIDSLSDLSTAVTINNETFKPIDKLTTAFSIEKFVRK